MLREGYPQVPPRRHRCIVRPADPERNFVSVGDFVAQIHPWLFPIRADLEAAMAKEDHDMVPWDAETRVWIMPPNVSELHLAGEKKGSFLGSYSDSWELVVKDAVLLKRNSDNTSASA